MNRIYGNPTDDYIKAPYRLDLLSEDGRLIAATAKRTGITRPGYIDKAVYQITWADGRADDTYYVYHNGTLTPSKEWHALGENLQPVATQPNPRRSKRETAATGAWDWSRGLEEKRPKRRGGNTIR